MGSISPAHNSHLVFHAQQEAYAEQVYKLIVLQENFARKDQATANSVSMGDKTKNRWRQTYIQMTIAQSVLQLNFAWAVYKLEIVRLVIIARKVLILLLQTLRMHLHALKIITANKERIIPTNVQAKNIPKEKDIYRKVIVLTVLMVITVKMIPAFNVLKVLTVQMVSLHRVFAHRQHTTTRHSNTVHLTANLAQLDISAAHLVLGI